MRTRRSFIRRSVLGAPAVSALRESGEGDAEITMSVPAQQKVCEEFEVEISATSPSGLDTVFVAAYDPASLGMDMTHFKGGHDCDGELACSVDLTTWCAHEAEIALQASLSEADARVREPIDFQPNDDSSSFRIEVRNEEGELTPVDYISLDEGLIGQNTTDRSAAEFRVPGAGRYEVSVGDSAYGDKTAEVYTSGDGEVKTIYLTETTSGTTTDRNGAPTDSPPADSDATGTASRDSLEAALRNPLLQAFLTFCTATGGVWASLNLYKKLFRR